MILGPDGHKSEYDANLLRKLISTRMKPQNEVVHWDVEKIKSVTDNSVTCKEYFENPNGKRRLLKSLLKYGFGFVTGVCSHFNCIPI